MPAKPKAKPTTDVVLRPTGEAVKAEFARMVTAIPEAEEDGGMGIVWDILNAGNLDQLDANWQDGDAEEYTDRLLEFVQITRHPSDFADGLGVFLRVDAVEIGTGQAFSFSTGSVSCVAQLVKAWVENWYPFKGVIRKAERPTRKGYYPLHIEVERA